VTQALSRQFALFGVTGSVRVALSLLDMADVDAIAQIARVPLSSLLGSSPKSLRAYDSRGSADGIGSPRGKVRALLEGGLGPLSSGRYHRFPRTSPL